MLLAALLLLRSGAPHQFTKNQAANVLAHRFAPGALRHTPLNPPQVFAAYAALPLDFEANRGQFRSGVQYLTRAHGYDAFLSPTETVLALHPEAAPSPQTQAGREPRSTLRIKLVGANPRASLDAESPLRARTNYLLGNDPRRWHTNVPHFSQLRAQSVYPGIDAVLHGNGQDLEYDFLISPGADPRSIALDIRGASRMRLNANSDAIIAAAHREITLHRPLMYQGRGAARHAIAGAYRLVGAHTLKFSVGPYDRRQPLLIDPSISVAYTTFLGGSGTEAGNSVALDLFGHAYIGGNTTSPLFSEIAGADLGPLGGDDLFIAEVDTTQSGANSLVYLTFLGGSGNDDGGFLAIDSKNNAAFLAVTTSSDFPVTDKSVRHTGANDLIVGELNSSGSALTFATYFGGNGVEMTQSAGGIAVDSSDNVFVTADTSSTNLPVTSGAFNGIYGGGISDGFLAKFVPGGALSYCSYFGINAQAGSAAVAADAQGNVFVAGFTSAPSGTSFPAKNAFMPTYPGGTFDGYVLKFNTLGQGASDLLYATFLGGNILDKAAAIAVDAANPASAYVTGETQSFNFPLAGAPYQSVLNGASDAFLAVIAQSSAGATSLFYSTYLGGSSNETGMGVAVARAPNTGVYVTGMTTSFDFPAQNPLQPFSGTMDGFLVKFDPTMAGASSLVYSTCLGGSATSVTGQVTVDPAGNIYIAGSSTSPDYPRAGNPNNGLQLICASCGLPTPAADAILTKIAEVAGSTPGITFLPPGLNFGNVLAHTIAPPISFLVQNNGTAPLTISSIGIGGTNAVDFSQTNNCPISPGTLLTGSNCTVVVTFTPTLPAIESAAIVLADDAPGSPEQVIVLGTGLEPVASPAPTSIDFGFQQVGTTSNVQQVTLSNTGNSTLHITGLNIIGGDTADFTFADVDTCISMVAPGSSCIFDVVFVPMAIGTFNSQVVLLDDSGNIPNTQQLILLTGTGVPPGPLVVLSTNALNFGTQTVGTVSAPQTVMVQNAGSLSLQISGISLVGVNLLEFNIVPSGTTCPVLGGSLAPGSFCNVAVDFGPLSAGNKSAQLAVADNAPGSPQAVALTGIAGSSGISLIPASLTFASQTVGTSSAPQTITLSNPGTAVLAISSIAITGANIADFLQASNCPPTVNPGSSCVIQATFLPQAAGSRTASLTVTDNAAGSPQSVTLSGTGTTPALTLTPSALTFPAQLVGAPSSAAMPLTVTNASSTSLSITGISFAGINPRDFSETDTCGPPLGAGATCTVSVTFTPAGTGTRSATITVAGSLPGTSATATLNGAGSDFSMAAASGGSTSATVVHGQTASYSLQLNPLDGFTGAVALTCTSPAPFSSCAPSVPTLMASSNAPVPFTVTVGTTATVPPARRAPHDNHRQPLVPVTFLLFLVTLLFAAAASASLAWRSRPAVHTLRLASVSDAALRGSQARRFQCAPLPWVLPGIFSWVAPLAVAGLLIILAACGGGGGGGGGTITPTGTPAGNYTITVTGTQQGVSRTLSLTLTVQ